MLFYSAPLSPLLLFGIVVFHSFSLPLPLPLPLYRRRKIYAQPISLKEIATSDAGPFKIDLRLLPHQECKRREPGKEEIAS